MFSTLASLILIYALGVCTGMVIVINKVIRDKMAEINASVAKIETVVNSWNTRSN